MNLHNLKPAKGSVHKEGKRLGRGEGSKKGGTSGRGHKGAKSRSGYTRKIGHEGGQMPLQRRVPKFGFINRNSIVYVPINLNTIQALHEKLDINVFDHEVFKKNGLISKNDKYKILGRGTLSAKIEVSAHAFSGTAKEEIEKLGGKAINL